MYGKNNMETYITICKIDSQWEFAVWLRGKKKTVFSREKGSLSPLYCLYSFVKDQLAIYVQVYFSAHCSVLLISVNSPASHCVDYCGFIVNLEVRQYHVHCCSRPLFCLLCCAFPYKLLNQFVDSHKIICWNFDSDCVELIGHIGRTDIIILIDMKYFSICMYMFFDFFIQIL